MITTRTDNGVPPAAPASMLQELRLYQLISPALPIGAFTYSQGLEWAIERGWVRDRNSLEAWLDSVLTHSVATLELPVLLRLYAAFEQQNVVQFQRWSQLLLANRETSELRAEERQRGQALLRLLPDLGLSVAEEWRPAVAASQLGGMALAAQQWGISPQALCLGYAWSWLENAVMAGVKLVPLGQTAGQQLLLSLSQRLPTLIEQAQTLDNEAIGSSTPALAIASSRHETQYTRLFRS